MKPAAAKVAGASSSRSGKREQDAPATVNATLTPKLRFPEFPRISADQPADQGQPGK